MKKGSAGVGGGSSRRVVCLRVEQLGIAVERARLPDLTGEPLALATDGVIQTASEEAAQWGVGEGITTQGARSLCDSLIILPYDQEAYETAARSLWNALATESSVVEPVSPELAYAELQGAKTQETGNQTLWRLAEIIASHLQVPVQMGIAGSKFAALQAARQDTGGSVSIPPGEEARFLAGVPLALLPNSLKLEKKTRKQMERLGIKNLGDLWTLPPSRLPRSLQKTGYQLLQWAQGYDSDPVKPLWPPRSVSAGTRFEEGVCDRFPVEASLKQLAQSLSRQLLGRQEYCREVTLLVGLEDHTWLEEKGRLALPESQAASLFRAALRLLGRLRIEQPITALELTGSDLGVGGGVQLSLLDRAGELPRERGKRLEATLAALRKRYGPRALIPAALLAKARRIHLWTYPLGHLLSEPLLQVATDKAGVPLCYWRQGGYPGRRYQILAIHDRWRETGRWRGILTDAEVWRVETDPSGTSELRRLENGWQLTGAWD